jgi:hypothetical protein
MNFGERPFLKMDANHCPVTPGIEILLADETCYLGAESGFEGEIYKTG